MKNITVKETVFESKTVMKLSAKVTRNFQSLPTKKMLVKQTSEGAFYSHFSEKRNICKTEVPGFPRDQEKIAILDSIFLNF